MLSNNITITAKGNRRIKLSIYSGHFATGHAHVDRYISMTEIRSNAAMAAEAADEISKFFRCTPIDTIICLENTQVIGAFIAQDLIDSSHSVNSGATGQNGMGKAIWLRSSADKPRRMAKWDSRIISHTHTVANAASEAISTNTCSGIR